MTSVLVLAAGVGARLRLLTADRPKCLIELAGHSLLAIQVSVFRQFGIEDITVVAGYKAERIQALGWTVVLNPHYACTDMVASLFYARHKMLQARELVISYGDIVYEPQVLQSLLECQAPLGVVVDRQWRRLWELRFSDPLSDAETLKMTDNYRLTEIGKTPKNYSEIAAQYIGLIKVRSDCTEAFVSVYDELNRRSLSHREKLSRLHMTSFLQHLIEEGWHVQGVPIDGGWLELDSEADYRLYKRLIAEGKIK